MGSALQHRELCTVSWVRTWWKIVYKKEYIYIYFIKKNIHIYIYIYIYIHTHTDIHGEMWGPQVEIPYYCWCVSPVGNFIFISGSVVMTVFYFYYFFFFFKATPVAYSHSHSKSRSKPHLWPMARHSLWQHWILNPLSYARDWTTSSRRQYLVLNPLTTGTLKDIFLTQ